jgi:sarcosine oxidase gamma subunit
VTALPEFVVADPASPAWRSPLRHALPMPRHGIRDVTADVGEAESAALGPAAGLAGIEVTGEHAETIVRRLTDLDLAALPSVGALAHVRALLQRAGDGYRIWFAQEYSDYLAEVVLDTAEGVA